MSNPTAAIWTELRPRLLDDPALSTVFLECARALGDEAAAMPERLTALRDDFLERAGCAATPRAQEARIAVSVLCDLRAMGWTYRAEDGAVLTRAPDAGGLDAQAHKAFVRGGHLLERDAQLSQAAPRAFVRSMERRRPAGTGWHSIFSLMRDGRELARALEAAREGAVGAEREAVLGRVIRPYVQVAERGQRCRFTGLDLFDVWRYFRHTWTTMYQSTPGRSMAFLVRDAAAPNHPVIGIAALGSSIVQLRVRDTWIGWTTEAFLSRVREKPSLAWARWLDREFRDLLSEVYRDDFLAEGIVSRDDFEAPHTEVIARLRAAAREARDLHRLYPQREQHKTRDDADPAERASTHLFRFKRAQALADLLEIRRDLLATGFAEPTLANLRRTLAEPRGAHAVAAVLRRVKAKRVGVCMMDLTVCGAIAPYSALLGGKLVSLLMTGAEVTRAYAEHYQGATSVIASGMANRPVRRSPTLVLQGTTSLYGTAPSQYNRIRMPASAAGGRPGEEIRFEPLGRTGGFGSYHYSVETLREMELLLAQQQRGREVNSIFGEGVNPKLRKVRAALDAVGLPSDLLLRHGHSRIVYGIPLASNFRDVLVGLDPRPRYILPQRGKSADAITRFWVRRWLAARIEQPEVISAVARHCLVYPVEHGARVPLPPGDELELPI